MNQSNAILAEMIRRRDLMTEAIEQYQAAFGSIEEPKPEPATDQAIHPATEPAHTRRMNTRQKRRMAQISKERWAVVKAAGVDTRGKIPTAEMVDRARAILARRTSRRRE